MLQRYSGSCLGFSMVEVLVEVLDIVSEIVLVALLEILLVDATYG